MPPSALTLVSPSTAYQDAFQNYVLDYVRRREAFWIDYYGQALEDFRAYLSRLANARQETWWGVLSRKQLVGVTRLRTELDTYTYNYLGHIGFDVAPSQRGQGYATQLLQLTLAKARAHGLSKVLLICDVDNGAASRVIEKQGGIPEGELDSEFSGKRARRYWVEVQGIPPAAADRGLSGSACLKC